MNGRPARARSSGGSGSGAWRAGTATRCYICCMGARHAVVALVVAGSTAATWGSTALAAGWTGTVHVTEHVRESRIADSESDRTATWQVAGSRQRERSAGRHVWTNPASWTASERGLLRTGPSWCPQYIVNSSGSGSAGSHGPGAVSSETLVVRLDLRNRTYSVSLLPTRTFPIKIEQFDCASGAVTREDFDVRSPASNTRPLGVRPLPAHFARTRRVTGYAEEVDAGFPSRTLDTVAWDLTLDEPGFDVVPPQTILRRTPAARTTSRAATFRFGATERRSTFECRLDRGPWARCAAPKAYRGLARRTHVFRVRATDANGNRDQTPARYVWRVTRP